MLTTALSASQAAAEPVSRQGCESNRAAEPDDRQKGVCRDQAAGLEGGVAVA